MNRTLSLIILLLLMSLTAFGCGSGQPIPAWQRELKTYVNNHGHGEISALRNLEDSPGRPGFTVISASSGGFKPFSASRTDIHGLLLGRENISGQSWMFFLIGVDDFNGDMTYFPLENAKISDIRLVALSWNAGNPDWLVSKPSPASLSQYSSSLKALVEKQDPAKASSLLIFPNRADRFTLAVDSSSAIATHTASGAQWSIQFTPPFTALKPSS